MSPGELLDRITILEIKSERVKDSGKRALLLLDYADALNVWTAEFLGQPYPELRAELKAANEQLWTLENRARRTLDLNAGASNHLLEQITATNDRRAALKREINALLGSPRQEIKEYTP